ncbi:hypothetical protein [Nocardia sp. MH4]|nr:hypothetical protein [Nocardia sp. MH4]
MSTNSGVERGRWRRDAGSRLGVAAPSEPGLLVEVEAPAARA